MNIDINKIKSNPNNPRIIKDEKFRKLVKSIKEFPKMMELRPIMIDEDNMVIGGNMRLKACKELKLKKVPVTVFTKEMATETLKERAEGVTYDDLVNELIIKDNLGFGEWDWDVLANEWDIDKLEDWGLDVFIDDKIDNLEEDEEMELPQSVQLEPPKEYILIMADPNSVDWEDLKETLKLKMVRRGGYKKGSVFDVVSLERVLYWNDFKKRINVNSSTK